MSLAAKRKKKKSSNRIKDKQVPHTVLQKLSPKSLTSLLTVIRIVPLWHWGPISHRCNDLCDLAEVWKVCSDQTLYQILFQGIFNLRRAVSERYVPTRHFIGFYSRESFTFQGAVSGKYVPTRHFVGFYSRESFNFQGAVSGRYVPTRHFIGFYSRESLTFKELCLEGMFRPDTLSDSIPGNL